MAPHIATPVSVIWSTTEAAAKVIAAKTTTSANIMRSGRGTRIGVFWEVPRGYMALASHSRRCEHGCGDKCSRKKFTLSHSVFPFDMKGPTASGSSMQMVKRLDQQKEHILTSLQLYARSAGLTITNALNSGHGHSASPEHLGVSGDPEQTWWISRFTHSSFKVSRGRSVIALWNGSPLRA